MSEIRIAEEHELTETGRCRALLEAVLKGLGASNCWAVNDRPDWEHEMAKSSDEERSFSALLEHVKGEFQVLADGFADVTKRVYNLDAKVDRVAKELSDRMEVGFATVVKELRNHSGK